MAWNNNDYVDVAARLREFKEKWPDGSLQTVSVEFKEIGGQTLILYTAAAYRSPEDPRPGIAMASEPFPGKTNFTRDSEIMNAETSAWGRAVIAADGSIVTKKVASLNEVINRTGETWDAPQGAAPKKGVDW